MVAGPARRAADRGPEDQPVAAPLVRELRDPGRHRVRRRRLGLRGRPAARSLDHPADRRGLPPAARPRLGPLGGVLAGRAAGRRPLRRRGRGAVRRRIDVFSRETDASKVALVALVDMLRAAGGAGRLLDVQWATDHLTRWAPSRSRAPGVPRPARSGSRTAVSDLRPQRRREDLWVSADRYKDRRGASPARPSRKRQCAYVRH